MLIVLSFHNMIMIMIIEKEIAFLDGFYNIWWEIIAKSETHNQKWILKANKIWICYRLYHNTFFNESWSYAWFNISSSHYNADKSGVLPSKKHQSEKKTHQFTCNAWIHLLIQPIISSFDTKDETAVSKSVVVMSFTIFF